MVWQLPLAKMATWQIEGQTVHICKSPRDLTLVFLRDGETPPMRLSFSRAPNPSPARHHWSSHRLLRGIAVAHHPMPAGCNRR